MEPDLIRFAETDLFAFSEASGDRNPLHLSREYARATPYGDPVVFGCLGAIACLGRVGLPADLLVTRLEADFLRPMFAGVTYRVEPLRGEDTWKATLFDGSTPVLALIVTGQLSKRVNESRRAVVERFSHREAVRWAGGIKQGVTIVDQYACDREALMRVTRRWNVQGSAGEFMAGALACTSYLVGMEIPGESALFSRLTLNFAKSSDCASLMRYSVLVAAVDARLGRIRTDVSLDSESGEPVAKGQLVAFDREALGGAREPDFSGVNSDALVGRTAVLIGSSRGLGAAIKKSLQARGAKVYGISRSEKDGSPRNEVGDAADPIVLRRTRDRILKDAGRFDFLICNASPPIPSLRLEPNAAERIAAHIQQAIALTLAPLTEFLESLNEAEGCVVIVSSSVVDEPVREWPHYLAAKRAIEALGQVAAMQYPRVRVLIVRPRKLLTTLTNTPLGRIGAEVPAVIAERIATRLEKPLLPGKAEILDEPEH